MNFPEVLASAFGSIFLTSAVSRLFPELAIGLVPK